MAVIALPTRLAEKVELHLAHLLSESPNPRAEASEMAERLEEAGLFDSYLPPKASPALLAKVLIGKNPLMVDRLLPENQRREWSPRDCETVGDLVSNLLPAGPSLD